MVFFIIILNQDGNDLENQAILLVQKNIKKKLAWNFKLLFNFKLVVYI